MDRHLEETMLVLFLIVISCVMLSQIIARYVFVSSMSWPEELCRFCWIWSVFLSLPYTIRHVNMLRVNILINIFPPVVRKTVGLLIDFIVTLIMSVFFRFSITVMQNYIKNGTLSTALAWPLSIVYCCILLGFGLGALRGVQTIVNDIVHFRDEALTTAEQTMREAAEETAAAREYRPEDAADTAEGGSECRH
jgi:TRAP-type C4-dicarboxylate transport system permease small subunit